VFGTGPTAVTGPGGLALDGDNNGTPGGDNTVNLHRLFGDVDGDGWFDLFVPHLTEENHTFWRQGPRGLFQDGTAGSGLLEIPWHGTGFAAVFADFDCDGAFAAESIDQIVALLGSDFRRKLKPLAESRWAHDPFARGAYSHALPGHAGDRAVLAAPVDGRLFFAGEATSPNFFSTAHGARDSGERAAEEVIASLAK